MAAIPYRSEVDGLRAVAILGVLVYHIDSKWLSGGFTGVDVFFVISGYLITSIIFEEVNRGSFSMKNFYTRRLKRLFPAMAAMLAIVLFLGSIISPATSPALGKGILWVLFLGANIHIMLSVGDYWAPGVEELPILHTWSLAVEEHFYLLFPVAFVLLLRWRRHWVFGAIVLVTLFSFCCCVYGTGVHPGATFYLIPTRAWELSIGSVVALYPPALSGRLAKSRWAGVGSGVGLMCILLAYFVLQGGHWFPGFRAALPVLGTVMVIAFTGAGGGFVESILRHPWMVHIGKASYSLYLWHWPVIVFVREIQDNPILILNLPIWAICPAIIILSSVLALLSYTFVERPLRTWRWTPAFCAIAFLGLTAAGRHISAKFDGINMTEGFAPWVSRGEGFCLNAKRVAVETSSHHDANALSAQRTPSFEEGVMRAYGKDQAEVLVLGDSQSLAYAPVIDDILRSNKISGRFFCASAVPPDLFRTDSSLSRALGSFSILESFDGARKRLLDSERPKLTIWIQRYDFRLFEDVLPSIRYILDRSTCVFVRQPPMLNIGNNPTSETFGYYRNFARTPLAELNIVEKRSVAGNRKRFEEGIRGAFQTNANFVWFDTSRELTASDNRIRWWDGVSRLYYRDDDHLTEYGSELFRERLEEAIVKVVKPRSR